ncbi:UdgX family uracil-DNA binding protein [Nitrospira moscoviensis]|uniref:Type-4 uracil-DNA glycosylase n=1 Tax=Nitrospira moscoviensis TaxID=42253 RepID=A0A0K2G8Z1_NITMO|nr:UdgX family uracil-DNA binding protein [Nitrospira moscoviensis]ALA57082.1 Phage SPO1 DNA polymerase-related protein [Nitrospira moscoviensis]
MRGPARSAAQFFPATLTIPHLQEAAASCTGCDLYQRATQTVFGEGAFQATVVFVGEQPGDQEDQAGHPFVGPAGKILDKALTEAGIARRDVYVTNAVKHFKWEPQGKRRKHKKPSAAEIAACRPWLEAEVQVVQPRVVVCLGVTAAQSVFGKVVRVNELRGRPWSTPMAQTVFVTAHPSAILRHPEAAQREEEYRRFVEDLKRIRRFLQAEAA